MLSFALLSQKVLIDFFYTNCHMKVSARETVQLYRLKEGLIEDVFGAVCLQWIRGNTSGTSNIKRLTGASLEQFLSSLFK